MSKQGQLNQKLPHFHEICEGAQESDNPVQYLKLACAADARVGAILGYCANPRFKLPFPDGTPPYQPASYPDASLAELGILHQHNKMISLFNPDMKQFKREELFVRWLEGMYSVEAEIMCRLKDQNLHAKYPKITKFVIAEALGWPLDKFQTMLDAAGLKE